MAIHRLFRRLLTEDVRRRALSRRVKAMFGPTRMLVISSHPGGSTGNVYIETADLMQVRGTIDEVNELLDDFQHFRRTEALLARWERMIPRRVGDEDLADYLEIVYERLAEGQGVRAWKTVWKAVLSTARNSVEYKMKDIAKR